MLRTDVINEIWQERLRQIGEEDYTVTHDDEHTDFSLSKAAACYADCAATHFDIEDEYEVIEAPRDWPWDDKFWKPKTPRRDLVRAAALIIAEIERIDRAKAREAAQNET